MPSFHHHARPVEEAEAIAWCESVKLRCYFYARALAEEGNKPQVNATRLMVLAQEVSAFLWEIGSSFPTPAS